MLELQYNFERQSNNFHEWLFETAKNIDYSKSESLIIEN